MFCAGREDGKVEKVFRARELEEMMSEESIRMYKGLGMNGSEVETEKDELRKKRVCITPGDV